MTLDHLIATVPDLRASHQRLLAWGFEEAWPPGPFWPAATTSGIALGGANLELVQPDSGVAEPWIDTLVLAPESLEEGRAIPLAFEERAKLEPDPALLALRGFPPERTREPQTICTNLYPLDAPYPFFLCLYVPFLKARLAPANFAAPRGPIRELSLSAPDPGRVRSLFGGRVGTISLDVARGDRAVVGAIRFADGSSLSQDDL